MHLCLLIYAVYLWGKYIDNGLLQGTLLVMASILSDQTKTNIGGYVSVNQSYYLNKS